MIIATPTYSSFANTSAWKIYTASLHCRHSLEKLLELTKKPNSLLPILTPTSRIS